MTAAEVADLFRSHSRLKGALAGNVETWLSMPGTLARYLDLVPVPGADETRLLEIGCYQPSVGYYFKLGWKNIVGVFKEDGEGTLEDGYAGENGEHVRFLKVDAEIEQLPVNEGWADAVVMMEVLEHFGVDPMHVLWEVNRVLKPGGRFILSTPNGASWHYAWRITRGQAAWAGMEFTGFSTDRHNRLYDAQELPVILQQAGFRVIRCASRDYADVKLHWRERLFRAFFGGIDSLSRLVSTRRPERGEYLIAQAVKENPPQERYPASLYLSAPEWPGIAQQREAVLARRNASSLS